MKGLLQHEFYRFSWKSKVIFYKKAFQGHNSQDGTASILFSTDFNNYIVIFELPIVRFNNVFKPILWLRRGVLSQEKRLYFLTTLHTSVHCNQIMGLITLDFNWQRSCFFRFNRGLVQSFIRKNPFFYRILGIIN